MPQISIIIPTYRRRNLLLECLQSCTPLGSTAEALVVDDGSSDGTIEAVEDLKSRLPRDGLRLRLIAVGSRQGAQACRNLGLANAEGDYVMYLDSDDVLLPGKIQSAMKVLQREGTDFVHAKVQKSNFRLEPTPGAVTGSPYSNSGRDLARYHWPIMGGIYTRDLADRVGKWDNRLSGSQDWEYQARVKLQARGKTFFPEIVALWRQHDGERVGTPKFRYDYVQSTILACHIIAEHARAANRYDIDLAGALARKMFLHGLEFSVHGFPKEAQEAFRRIKVMPGVPVLYKAFVSAFSLSPRLHNSLVYHAIRTVKGS